jgi:hypothetical protein
MIKKIEQLKNKRRGRPKTEEEIKEYMHVSIQPSLKEKFFDYCKEKTYSPAARIRFLMEKDLRGEI